MADVSRVDIVVADKVSPNISRKLKAISKNARLTHKGITTLNKSLKNTRGSFKVVANGFGNLIRYGKIYLSLRLAKSILTTADALVILQNKLRNVSDSQQQLNTLTEEMFNIARESRISVLSVAKAYQRFDLALMKTGASQRESLELTETLTKALVLSGASAQETASAMLQLSQAFNEGRLRGQEFRTLSQTVPKLLDKIADGLGVNVGELQKLASRGELNIEVLRGAFRNLKDEIDEKFKDTVPTLSQAFTVLGNTLVKVVGGFNEGVQGTQTLSQGILDLSDAVSKSTGEWVLLGKIVKAESKSWGIAFTGWVDTVLLGYEFIGKGTKDLYVSMANDFIENLKSLPATALLLATDVGLAIAKIIQYAKATVEATGRIFKAGFEHLTRHAKNLSKALTDALDLTDGISAAQAMEEYSARALISTRQLYVDIHKSNEQFNKDLQETGLTIAFLNTLNEKRFNRTIAGLDASSQKVRTLTEEYKKLRAERLKPAGKPASGGLRPETQPQEPGLVEPTGDIKRLLDNLTQRRTLYQTHYERVRGDRIAAYEKDQNLLTEALGKRMIATSNDLDKRMAATLTYQKLSKENWKRFQEDLTIIQRNENKRREMERARQAQSQLRATSALFTALANLEQGKNKESIKRQQAFAIAAATIDTFAGAAQVLSDRSLTTYTKFVAAAAIVANGLSQIQQIRSAGNFANGGIVGGTSFSGDNVPINVNSREMVLNMSQQRRLFEMANGGGANANGGGVTIINQTSTPVEAETRTDKRGNREIIIREAVQRTKQELTNEANIGGGQFVPALKQNFGLVRVGV